jgi:membrane associated rhomboid family serine protease
MTLIILIITGLISFAAFSQPAIIDRFVFQPYAIKHHREWYRYITSGLLHADFMHLFVNMFVFYSFGQAVEYYYKGIFGNMGSWMYVLLYVTSIFAANVSTYFKEQNNPTYRSLGASGAVSAVVFASILFNPYQPLVLMFAIEMPAILYGVLYLGYSYYMSKKDFGDNVHHEAHLQGALYGMLFTVVMKPQVLGGFIDKLF